jgi:hypothetical protein
VTAWQQFILGLLGHVVIVATIVLNGWFQARRDKRKHHYDMETRQLMQELRTVTGMREHPRNGDARRLQETYTGREGC